MEHEQDNAGATGVSRGQNQLHLLPEDWRSAATVIEPLLDRLETGNAAPQLLVLTSDAEAAAGISGRIAAAGTRRGLRTLAATDARRATRVQRAIPSPVVVGAPGVLVELLQSAVLKLDGVRVVVLAWVDDLSGAETRALETLMAELPKEAARSVLAGAMTPAVEQLVERYARRARHMQSASNESCEPVSLSFVAAGESTRSAVLRRILDALDPESAVVVTRNADSRLSVESLLRSLGYDGASGSVRVSDTPDAKAQLIVLYDLPATEEELRRIERGNARIVALVSPRQVPALRRLAGGAVTPLALPEAAARARTREEGLRDELRQMLSTGQYSRELLALEPLLSDYDGAEVAAAALRLLEAERAKPQTPSAPAGQSAMTRLYLNIGEMDNVRPGDLVGAITNEAGISKSDLGRVDVRERHSTVEVATPVANAVVSKLTGVSIKGRRALVKIDEGEQRDRGPRRDSGGPPRDRGGPPRDRGSRPPRDRTRPERRPPRPRTDRD